MTRLPWSDPNSDPFGDIMDALEKMREEEPQQHCPPAAEDA